MLLNTIQGCSLVYKYEVEEHVSVYVELLEFTLQGNNIKH